jgi:hypothetical protein
VYLAVVSNGQNYSLYVGSAWSPGGLARRINTHWRQLRKSGEPDEDKVLYRRMRRPRHCTYFFPLLVLSHTFEDLHTSFIQLAETTMCIIFDTFRSFQLSSYRHTLLPPMSYEGINITVPFLQQCRLPCSYYFKRRMDRTLRGEKIWVDPRDPRGSCHSFVLGDRLTGFN